MRCWWAIAVTAVVLAACGASSPRSPSTGPAGSGNTRNPTTIACGPPTARTLGASAVARVYVSGHAVFGCSAHGSGALNLGDAVHCTLTNMVGPVEVRGELAGYGSLQCGTDTGMGSVVVRRLDNGQILHTAEALSGANLVEGYDQVVSLVLRPDGSAAWSAQETSAGFGGRIVQVLAIDRSGERILDSGPAIGLQSLRLSGSTVSWRHGTDTRTASLS